ncbi:MAG: uroporphyrinogen-III C-methyltransferase [Bacteroidales bacterium]|nr:uroporphyrinogen-III C-methyltransferase [Bacteroidales bacterium]
MIKLQKRKLLPVTIVGSGPGNPELLTLRAWHVLSKAGVILYDDLVGAEIIDIIPQSTEKIYVGKRYQDGANQKKRLENILHLYRKYLDMGKNLVRLKGGDPMIFSRTDAELVFLQNENIDYEIVPGLTSGLAGASLNSMPLTVREKVRSLVCLTASTIDGNDEFNEQVYNYLKLDSTVMIYMGGNMLDLLIEFLKKKMPGDLEIVLISNISRENQHIVSSTLKDVHNVLEVSVQLPVVIYLGYSLLNYIRNSKNVE